MLSRRSGNDELRHAGEDGERDECAYRSAAYLTPLWYWAIRCWSRSNLRQSETDESGVKWAALQSCSSNYLIFVPGPVRKLAEYFPDSIKALRTIVKYTFERIQGSGFRKIQLFQAVSCSLEKEMISTGPVFQGSLDESDSDCLSSFSRYA